MKILVAVPCMDMCPTPFVTSFRQLEVFPDAECHFLMQSGSLIYHARNDIARKAVTNEYDYVFWLDSDMVFEPFVLIRLMDTLQKNNLDFVTGIYFRRVPPFTPVLFDKLEMNGNLCKWTGFEKGFPPDLFEIGGCGFGAVLMKTDMFLDVQHKFGNMFCPIGNTGEDVAFCWRARQCGFKLWADPNVIFGHCGYQIVDEKHFQSFQVINSAMGPENSGPK